MVISKDELRKRLEELADYLINMEFDEAAECVESLKGISIGDETANTDLSDIIRMVENFDFEDAETNLKDLMGRL